MSQATKCLKRTNVSKDAISQRSQGVKCRKMKMSKKTKCLKISIYHKQVWYPSDNGKIVCFIWVHVRRSNISQSDYQISNKILWCFIYDFTERGECSFVSKTIKAQESGALAAIITDIDESQDELYVSMVDDTTERTVKIPSAYLLGKNG